MAPERGVGFATQCLLLGQLGLGAASAWGPEWCPGHPDRAASRTDVPEALERTRLAAAAPGEGPPQVLGQAGLFLCFRAQCDHHAGGGACMWAVGGEQGPGWATPPLRWSQVLHQWSRGPTWEEAGPR